MVFERGGEIRWSGGIGVVARGRVNQSKGLQLLQIVHDSFLPSTPSELALCTF